MRKEGDFWDITTSVGATALTVATARAIEAQKLDSLAVDPFAEVFARAIGGKWADVLDGKACGHKLQDPDFGPNFITFQGARTRYFDDYFARASEAGVRQVVILAAGLDSRAYRLSWPDGTTIFELDRAPVLDFKRGVLTACGAEPGAERREIAVDLRDPWAQALRDAGFRASAPSAWIVEGLLIYLPAVAQERLFTSIDSLAGPGSFAAIEDDAPMSPDGYAAAVEQERTASEGANDLFFQLIFNQQCAPAVGWFGEHGWTATGTLLADYLRELGRSLPAPDTYVGSVSVRKTLVTAVRPSGPSSDSREVTPPAS